MHLGIDWVLEQPTSSYFFRWPALQVYVTDPGCHTIVLDLALFGCFCNKMLMFKGSWGGLLMLKAIEVRMKELLPPELQKLDQRVSQESGRFCGGGGCLA